NPFRVQIDNRYINFRIFLSNDRHGWPTYITGTDTGDIFDWFHSFFIFYSLSAYLCIHLFADESIREFAYLASLRSALPRVLLSIACLELAERLHYSN